jgi:chromosome segregation ATPase
MVAHEKRWATEVDRAREAAKAANARLSQLERESVSQVRQLTQSLERVERDHREVTDLQLQSEAIIERLKEARAADSSELAALRVNFREREIMLNAQCERMQAQLSDALAQLAAKDREFGQSLRALLVKAQTGPRPSRRLRNSQSG